MDKLLTNRKIGEDDVTLGERLTHNDLKACYPVLVIIYDKQGIPKAQLRQWYQTEAIFSKGVFLDGCSNECSAIPINCVKR